MVEEAQMVCFECWSFLQVGWCCPFTCDSCTLYFGRECMCVPGRWDNNEFWWYRCSRVRL